MEKIEKNRIEEIRESHKLSMKKLADAASTTASQISKLEKGERGLDVHWMNRISRAFRELGINISPIDLIVGDITPDTVQPSSRDIPVIGQVEGGAFREATQWAEDLQYHVASTIQNDHHAAKCFGLEVIGESMNKVYPAGTVVIVMPLTDYLSIPRKLESGDKVVVYRHRAGLIEATIKEFVQKPDSKAELWPRSTHPEYQSPINIHWPNGEHNTDVDCVEIAAVVIQSIKVEKRL